MEWSIFYINPIGGYLTHQIVVFKRKSVLIVPEKLDFPEEKFKKALWMRIGGGNVETKKNTKKIEKSKFFFAQK